MNITWDAEKYSDDFSFVHKYGGDVLSLVDSTSGGIAVDLGCGNGELTAKIAEMGFRTVGIDASEEMLSVAKKKFPNLDFRIGDALDFSVEDYFGEKADLIFSNAVFHWIDEEKQVALAKNLFRNLKSGGQLVFEFGGAGCAESVHSALEAEFSKRGLKYNRVFYFPTIAEHAKVLEDAGFKVNYATLFDRPTVQVGDYGIVNWIKMFDKTPFGISELGGIDTPLSEEIMLSAEEGLREKLFDGEKWIVDYVWIRMLAIA